MNPLDKSWEFLKAPIDEKKHAFEEKQREQEDAAQKKKARDAQSAKTTQTKLNLGSNMQESAPYPGFNPKLMAEIEARKKTPLERVTTTPSKESLDTPTEGTGFDTLTPEQIQALKYHRRGA